MVKCPAARLAKSVKVVSAIGTMVLVGATIALVTDIPHGTRVPWAEEFGTLLTVLPGSIALIALGFVVRGYEIDRNELRVRRLLWLTRIPLTDLARAYHDPKAMTGSLRLFGNGGLYAVTGLYRNRALGSYRAFLTDPSRSVVLETRRRKLVISPSQPEVFLEELRAVVPGIEIGKPDDPRLAGMRVR